MCMMKENLERTKKTMLLCCAYERNSGMILRNAIMMNVRARAHFLDLLSFIECLLKCYHHHTKNKQTQRKTSHHPGPENFWWIFIAFISIAQILNFLMNFQHMRVKFAINFVMENRFMVDSKPPFIFILSFSLPQSGVAYQLSPLWTNEAPRVHFWVEKKLKTDKKETWI